VNHKEEEFFATIMTAAAAATTTTTFVARSVVKTPDSFSCRKTPGHTRCLGKRTCLWQTGCMVTLNICKSCYIILRFLILFLFLWVHGTVQALRKKPEGLGFDCRCGSLEFWDWRAKQQIRCLCRFTYYNKIRPVRQLCCVLRRPKSNK
jgi:hypothetical protein